MGSQGSPWLLPPVDCLICAGKYRELPDQIEVAKEAAHGRLEPGQEQSTARLLGSRPDGHQFADASAVHEGHFREIRDDPQLRRDSSLEYARSTRGIGYVQLTAQQNDHVTSACTGTRTDVGHLAYLLTKQPGGVSTRMPDSLAPKQITSRSLHCHPPEAGAAGQQGALPEGRPRPSGRRELKRNSPSSHARASRPYAAMT
jgi:hypothetical protein